MLYTVENLNAPEHIHRFTFVLADTLNKSKHFARDFLYEVFDIDDANLRVRKVQPKNALGNYVLCEGELIALDNWEGVVGEYNNCTFYDEEENDSPFASDSEEHAHFDSKERLACY